jgi:hypothetical protein
MVNFYQDVIYRRHENMFVSTPTAATSYCSIHGKFFLESLQAWCSLPSTHVPSPAGNPELTEAPCDECMMLALRTFKAQFPSLYTPRMLKGLGKDIGYVPPRLAPSYTAGRVS